MFARLFIQTIFDIGEDRKKKENGKKKNKLKLSVFVSLFSKVKHDSKDTQLSKRFFTITQVGLRISTKPAKI